MPKQLIDRTNSAYLSEGSTSSQRCSVDASTYDVYCWGNNIYMQTGVDETQTVSVSGF